MERFSGFLSAWVSRPVFPVTFPTTTERIPPSLTGFPEADSISITFYNIGGSLAAADLYTRPADPDPFLVSLVAVSTATACHILYLSPLSTIVADLRERGLVTAKADNVPSASAAWHLGLTPVDSSLLVLEAAAVAGQLSSSDRSLVLDFIFEESLDVRKREGVQDHDQYPHLSSTNKTWLRLLPKKTYIAINSINDEHRIISGIGLQHYDPPITDLCYISKFSSDITFSPKCVEAILKNKNLNIINQYCYFQCIKQYDDDSIIIKQIGINTYVITNPQPILTIKKVILNITETEELELNYDPPGLIKITFPCNYELLRNDVVLIPKMYSCETNNLNTYLVKRVLPVSWTKIKSLNINHDTKKENIVFSNLIEILNQNCIEEIPNFHVTKQIQDTEKYFNDIMLKKMSQPLINDFLGDIIYITWLTMLTVVM
ncbi:hypothetical protein QTP88_014094 [Uroleucon formosanum]